MTEIAGRRQIWRCKCFAKKCTIRTNEDPSQFLRCSISTPAWIRFRAKKGQKDMGDYFPEAVE